VEAVAVLKMDTPAELVELVVEEQEEQVRQQVPVEPEQSTPAQAVAEVVLLQQQVQVAQVAPASSSLPILPSIRI
jgi:hypothetical protein